MKLFYPGCLFVVLLSLHGNAAEPLINLTLDQAIEIAVGNHPKLSEGKANIESAKARAQAAGKLPNPEAIARVEAAPISGASQAEYLAGVSQTIPLGGRLSAARSAEEANFTTRSHELELARFELTRNVRNAFATALFSSELIQVQTNIATTLLELTRITQARVEEGDIASLELDRIQAEEALHRLGAKEASRLHQQAINGLTAAMGDFRMPIQSLAGSLADTLQIAAIKAEFLGEEHPALAAARSEVDAGKARLKLAWAERIPDLNFELLYRRVEHERLNAFDVGVRLPIPLFDRKSRVRQAGQELLASEARLEQARNQVGHERHRLELELQSALEAADILKDEVLPRTEKALAGAELRYKAGDTSLSELLLVRRDATASRLRYAETLRSVMEAWSGLNP